MRNLKVIQIQSHKSYLFDLLFALREDGKIFYKCDPDSNDSEWKEISDVPDIKNDKFSANLSSGVGFNNRKDI